MTVVCRLADIGQYVREIYPRLGLTEDTLVEVIPTSAGTLIVCRADTPTVDLPPERILYGGAAQLAYRRAAQKKEEHP
jgi:hypothetical protein